LNEKAVGVGGEKSIKVLMLVSAKACRKKSNRAVIGLLEYFP
jgi:hypothetical protein